MNSILKIYWWRGKSFSNFGDEINEGIIGYVSGKQIERVPLKDSELLGIGSLLTLPQNHFRIINHDKKIRVWGSGSLHPTNILCQEKFELNLLRGPLSHSLFDDWMSAPRVPYGDPGLLCSDVWPRGSSKKYQWGIVPHHSRVSSPEILRLQKNTPNSIIIDVRDDLDKIFDQMSSCVNIAASSLHGLIVADSYKIPNVWLWGGKLHGGGQWKFFDYFAGIQRKGVEPVDISSLEKLSQIDMSAYDFSHFNRIDEIKSRIISAFPADLK